MWEQSKAAMRRYRDGAFHSRYFVGDGIDIGSGPDGLASMLGIFPRMRSCRNWDLPDGDAQLMEGVPDSQYDFVHSSHCLEHMREVPEALYHWARILKPGGFLIVTVPDEDLYEHGQWPSRHNPDHKWSFTLHKNRSSMPNSLNILDLVLLMSNKLILERAWQINDFYCDSVGPEIDQTLLPTTECAIEVIWRKRR